MATSPKIMITKDFSEYIYTTLGANNICAMRMHESTNPAWTGEWSWHFPKFKPPEQIRYTNKLFGVNLSSEAQAQAQAQAQGDDVEKVVSFFLSTTPSNTVSTGDLNFDNDDIDLKEYNTPEKLRGYLHNYWAPRLRAWLIQNDAEGTNGRKVLSDYAGLMDITADSPVTIKNLGLIYVNLLAYHVILSQG
jgi:hypothetical protein